jgi:hypothetical protein
MTNAGVSGGTFFIKTLAASVKSLVLINPKLDPTHFISTPTSPRNFFKRDKKTYFLNAENRF